MMTASSNIADNRSEGGQPTEYLDRLDRMYRMPTVFGPSAGPRNVPASKQRSRYSNHRSQLTVDALTDANALTLYLPPRCRLVGEPILRVSAACVTRIGWLAGRGYNIITVQFPNIAFDGADGTLYGTFDGVLWESMCDPIITGREEIAIPKIYADIPDPIVIGDSYASSAAWQGFRFLNLKITDLVDASEAPALLPPRLSYKYTPKTGEWGQADAEYMTMATPDPNQPATVVHAYRVGGGSFEFHPARWEDMPTQFNIVNALAGIPIREFREAHLMITSQGTTESTGGGNGSGQRIVR